MQRDDRELVRKDCDVPEAEGSIRAFIRSSQQPVAWCVAHQSFDRFLPGLNVALGEPEFVNELVGNVFERQASKVEFWRCVF